MTILLPAGLPAAAALIGEGYDVVQQARRTAPVRAYGAALRIALVNLMPDKPRTELHIARMLASSGHDVHLTLVIPGGYRPTSTPAAHIADFYRPFDAVRGERFDGVIITGAPVETMPFAQVAYWPDLRAILDWASSTAWSSWCICWGAQASLHHFHGTPKHPLPAKAFGVHRQTVVTPDPLLEGLEGGFDVPISRHTEVRLRDLPDGVLVLAAGAGPGDGGLCLLRDRANRMVHQFNHPEYDADTLALEYRRDRQAGRMQAPPANYFPGGDERRLPAAHWRPAAMRLYANWLAEVAAARDAGAAGAIAGLTGHTGPAGLAELRLEPAEAGEGRSGPGFAVNELVEACGRFGVTPVSVRREDQGGALCAILPALPEPQADRLVRRLVPALGARRVSYHALDGSVGILAVRPPPLATTANVPAPDLPADLMGRVPKRAAA